MKHLALLLLFSGTMVAAPPNLGDWRSPRPEPIRRSHRFGDLLRQGYEGQERPTQEKNPDEEAEKVHSVSTEAIKNRIQAGCIEYTCVLLNGNLDKHERDVARWRLTNLKNHPYYDPHAYDCRDAGHFPHSGNDGY